MGNKNRFNTKHECLKQCRYKLFNPVAVPDLCLLEPDPGYCNDETKGQWWFFFNSDAGICEKFFFYGCGGNDNKFYSLHMCNKVCGERLSPQIACERCDLRTSFCKSHSKFNYTCECRLGYEKNKYGECIGVIVLFYRIRTMLTNAVDTQQHVTRTPGAPTPLDRIAVNVWRRTEVMANTAPM
ncbi:Kunitz/Bovine pancreatic trypsin inhibitor domain protein [Ancylostoma duodenale]|uniref:Kunitz/Bovine pancreatic trypsin inhibitor domain protein n=1 Tax=Ancylostoma duodenale TaxID=51022 RepID=A0A0C2FIL1_9BILA|nr:Kunitz/Bovine pancreatic trypsin inhibitor domain protein [Ancylostoma duodenale]